MLGFGPADLAAGASVHVHITSPTTSATVADSPVDNTASITATNVSPPAPASASISVFADGLSCENLSEEFDMDGGGTTTIGFADPADCTDVPFTFSYDRDANEFEIEKNELTVGLAVTVEWPAELAPTAAANLQVTPTEVTPPAPFHPVQWCEGDGTPENSTPPGVESWCILSQSASNFGPASGGGQLIQVTDELLLFGDANGRR